MSYLITTVIWNTCRLVCLGNYNTFLKINVIEFCTFSFCLMSGNLALCVCCDTGKTCVKLSRCSYMSSCSFYFLTNQFWFILCFSYVLLKYTSLKKKKKYSWNGTMWDMCNDHFGSGCMGWIIGVE